MRLHLKMLGGYVSLIILFIIASCIIIRENRKFEDSHRRYAQNIERRQLSEKAFLHLFDLTLLDEQIAVWNDEQLAEYEQKENTVLGMLDSMMLTIPDTAQVRRVGQIKRLVTEKKSRLLAIHADLDRLRDVEGLMKERMPEIIRRANRANERLTDEVSENLQENRHRTTGLKGLLKSKKKADAETEANNRQALSRAKRQTDEILSSLASDIEQSQERSAERLFAHMDTLIGRNRLLNAEISRLVTAFNNEDSQMRKHGSSHLMQHQERTLRMIACFGLAAFLLAVLFFWLLHRDIKQKQRNKHLLEISNEHNEELLALRHNIMLTVSHDLRAPLTAITRYADLIADAESEGMRLQYGEAVRQSADRMLALLNSLLSYYRLDTGKDEKDLVPFRVKDVLRSLLSEFEPLAANKRLDIEGRFYGDDTAVIGDRKRIIQIGSNLLSNAIKFTGSGMVSVAVSYADGTLRLVVKDTGTGMTEEQIKRIFAPFKRLENADTQEGFGLGLSITQALVKLLGGDIKVESVVGLGSRFEVTLPVSESDAELLQLTASGRATMLEGIRIAVLDDDAVVLAMTVEMLARKRAIADGCHTVNELLERLRRHNYDLIVTDLMLGSLSGFDLLELLRGANIGNAKTVPVLAMTGRTERSADDFKRAGFAGCIFKPFSYPELTRAVAESIKGAQPVVNETAKADFSVLFEGENDRNGMLTLLVEQTEMEMGDLCAAMETGDTDKISFLLHKLESRWEMLGIEKSLRGLREAMEHGGDLTDAVGEVLEAGQRLIEQANSMMEGGEA